jgi:hypothetical protein
MAALEQGAADAATTTTTTTTTTAEEAVAPSLSSSSSSSSSSGGGGGGGADEELAMKHLAGAPSDTATPAELLDYILWMIEDQQLIKAKACLDRLEAHPDIAASSGVEAPAATVTAAAAGELSVAVEGMLEARGLPTYKMRSLRRYVKEAEKAKSEFDNEEGWELAQDLFGVKTYWKMAPGERAIYTKMEGELQDLSLVCLASTLREIDLYSTWLPFCIMSDIAQWKGRCDVLCQFGIQVPFM